MSMPLWVKQFMLRVRPMKAILTIGYTKYVLDPQKALAVAGALMEAELYTSKYHGEGKGSTYHVFEQEGDAISIEMMPNNKYNLCKLAGKPEGS
jgi:hypothetical protein